MLRPSASLADIRANPVVASEFQRMRQVYIESKARGATRVRVLAPSVTQTRIHDRVVEEATWRFVRFEDYESIFNRPATVDNREPSWELMDGQWEWGYRIYEIDPRIRRITDRRIDRGAWDIVADAGTEEGGELRQGQLMDAFHHVQTRVASAPLSITDRAAWARAPTVEAMTRTVVQEAARTSEVGGLVDRGMEASGHSGLEEPGMDSLEDQVDIDGFLPPTAPPAPPKGRGGGAAKGWQGPRGEGNQGNRGNSTT
jgi:hypothetical protein